MPESTRPLPDLVLSDATVDRDALTRSRPGLLSHLLDDPATQVLEMRGDRAPVDDGALVWRSPVAEDRTWYDDGGVVLYLGRVGSRHAVAVLRAREDEAEVAKDAENSTHDTSDTSEGRESARASDRTGTPEVEPTWLTLRETGLDLPPGDVACFTSALALTQWHATHSHCPRCGARTLPREAGWVRRCEADGSQHFPRTDPAVIMAVIDEGSAAAAPATPAAPGTTADDATASPADDGSRILLARGSRWGGTHRSVLAGFVEPGESFEQAVRRETFEESGVQVGAVSYLGSQPWPFPASLMIGCIATAVSTDLTPQQGEIEEIAWYSRSDIEHALAHDTLTLPGRLSIARALIEHWYGGPLPDGAQQWR